MSKKEKIIFIVGILFSIGLSSVNAVTYLYGSKDVSYNNNISKLEATDVQDAIDELNTKAEDYSRLNNKIWPVGSIYISVTDKTVEKVEERLGGTWVSFGSGRTLVGVDPSDTDFDTVEEESGSKTQSYTPAGTNTGTALTIAQIPAHTHTETRWARNWNVNTTNTNSQVAGNAGSNVSSYTTGSTGGGQAHTHTFNGTTVTLSHMQPSITVYMYKRTA